MRKTLNKLEFLAIDTNIFVYFFTADSPFHLKSNVLFEEVFIKNIKIVTSNITLTEVLSYKASTSQIKLLEKELLNIPNLQIIELSNSIAIKAAQIRREYGYSLPDAIQLATAKLSKAKAFLTNDNRLKTYQGLKIILLSEIG